MLYDPKRWTMPEVKPVEEWRQLLLDGAARIRADGWCRGTGINSAGNRCALGSFVDVCLSKYGTVIYKFDDTQDIAAGKLARYLMPDRGQRKISDHSVIVIWNDTPGRTADEVIAALEGAARA